MNELFFTLSKEFPYPVFIFDRYGNISFLNKAGELFFKHFGIQPLSLTNYKDFKKTFPELYSTIDNYYTGIFVGTKTKFRVEFSPNLFVDITTVPNFDNGEFEGLGVILEDKTHIYKNLNKYEQNSQFLKEVIDTRNFLEPERYSVFFKSLKLMEKITNQKNILIYLKELNFDKNLFYKGFNKKFADFIVKKIDFLEKLILEQGNKYKLLENIFFIPEQIIEIKGSKNKIAQRNLLICQIKKDKKESLGFILVEFNENFIPYLSMIEQISLFLQFAPLIYGNFISTQQLVHQTQFIQEIINKVPHTIVVCNENLEVELINKKGIKTFHKKENNNLKEIIGENLFNAVNKMIINKIDTLDIENNNRHFTLKISKTKHTNNKKFIITIEEITEKKRAEKEIVEKEKLETIKSLWVTAHDRINNPLTVLITRLDILEEYLEMEPLNKKKIKELISSLKYQIDKIARTISLFDKLDQITLTKYANTEEIKQLVLKNIDE